MRLELGMPLRVVATSVAGVCLTVGCGHLPWFPVQVVKPDASRLAFDTDGDGCDDYWQDVGSDGRKVALHFDDDGDGRPDTAVPIDTPLPGDGLHVVIILDGVPFPVIEDLYQQGHFRLLPPPSRLISVFPAMTDLALAQAFQAGPCLGYEALYYDIKSNRLSNGNDVYMNGRNAPWEKMADYRCSTNWDVLTYLNPAAVWRHELDGFASTIAAAASGRVIMYTVATAGLGTRGGRGAIVDYLKTVDALCEQVTYQRRGKVRFTLFADHGHGLTPCRRVGFSQTLHDAGLKVTNTIRRNNDVVMPTYGLVTCLAINTRCPQRVAEVLLNQESVDLVMYPDAARESRPIIVRNRDGEALIRRHSDRYAYEAVRGDPLRLLPVIERLRVQGKVADDGSAADRDWFEATAAHEYPDPLHRVWCAFERGTLVENPADVLVSLKEGYASGSKFFSALVKVASTHGALSREGSTTFIMSNAVRPPPVMRIDDVAEVMDLAASDTPNAPVSAGQR